MLLVESGTVIVFNREENSLSFCAFYVFIFSPLFSSKVSIYRKRRGQVLTERFNRVHLFYFILQP